MYTAPIADMEFVLNELAGLPEIAKLPGYEDATPDLVRNVLEESAKISAEVLAPLNRVGDTESVRLVDGAVQTPGGWRDAYRTFIAGGWNSLPFAPRHGGHGLPWLVATAVQEMWHAANMAFGLCPLLTQCAADAIALHGDDRQRAVFLPKMVGGEWSGTMNLTEPQAGSDLGALKTTARRNGDHYLIRGQKIFITYGEHDLVENIVHLVLARTPDAPEGVKGISLFIVPKFVPAADGGIGERNDLRCVSLEHKLGIHGSPTALMSYGDDGGAVGYLVGEESRGLEYMFSMMNLARHTVGLEGVAIAERSYQQALAYAKERVQGRASGRERVTIIHHPDVKRMLLTMKSQIEAMRALAFTAAAGFDLWRRHPDQDRRAAAGRRVELLTPIVKGWCTETGTELTSIGVQVHGGMGFIEETGAAQHYRDARITAIYEGTTGIQAGDLLGRKLLRDKGAAAAELMAEMRGEGGADDALGEAVGALDEATQYLLREDLARGLAVSAPYLRLWGVTVGGWLMFRAAKIAARRAGEGGGDGVFYREKINTAEFYAAHVLPQARALAVTVVKGAASVGAFGAGG